VVTDPGTRLLAPRKDVHLLGRAEWPHLGVLAPYGSALRRLRIDVPARDVSALYRLTGLEELSLGPLASFEDAVDLERFPKLRFLAVEGDSPIDASRARSLTHLLASRPSGSWIDDLQELPRLETLVLLGPSELPRAFPETLRNLEISFVDSWPDDWVADGIANVTQLRFSRVRGLSDLHAFARIQALQTLITDDSDDLTSTDGPALCDDFRKWDIGRVDQA
jgi:hypothetical protein